MLLERTTRNVSNENIKGTIRKHNSMTLAKVSRVLWSQVVCTVVLTEPAIQRCNQLLPADLLWLAAVPVMNLYLASRTCTMIAAATVTLTCPLFVAYLALLLIKIRPTAQTFSLRL